jgi:formylglycine-generating enzyme required for sulfatase activity
MVGGLFLAAASHAQGPDLAPVASARALPACPPGMLRVAAGAFWMGSAEGEGNNEERPRHRAEVAAFCMDRTEVTVGAYTACVAGGRCKAAGKGDYCNYGKADKEQHPINCVDWNQADTFCRSRGKRLPTETEWEYAARGPDGRKYPWGSGEPEQQLCWRETGPLGTCPVGSFPLGASPFGLEDMAGNVKEWTASNYCPYPSKACTNAARVYRGIYWVYLGATLFRGADRHNNVTGDRLNSVGFRCAR